MRKWSPILLVLLLIVPAVQAGAVVLKIATVAPDGTFWMKEARKGAAEIEKRTDGRVTFQFYPGGTMGDTDVVMRKMRIGQLHGAAVTGGALSNIYPDNQIYNLPLLFNGYGEVEYVRERMDPILMKGMEDKGFVIFGIIDGGFAYLMSKKPVASIEDLKGQKVWGIEGDIISKTIFDAIGVNTLSVPLTDVLTALQTGLLDTVGTSPIGAIALQWHTKVNYMNDTPLLYIYGLFTIGKKAFSRLTPEDQAIVREELGRVSAAIDKQNKIDNEKALEALRNQGIEFQSPTPEELAEWRKIAAKAIETLGEKGAYTKPMLDKLRGYLAEYRAQNTAAPSTEN